MSWSPKFDIICNKHGSLFQTEYEENIQRTIRTHKKYNPHCKVEVKELTLNTKQVDLKVFGFKDPLKGS